MATLEIINTKETNQKILDYLFNLLQNAERHEEFLQVQRNKLFQFTLIFFTAVMGFILKFEISKEIPISLVYFFIDIIMIWALWYEVRIHKFALAWDSTFRQHRKIIADVINLAKNPIIVITFDKNNRDAYRLKYWFFSRRLVYYIFIIAPLVCLFLNLGCYK